MIIRKNVEAGDRKERIVMSRGSTSARRGNPVVSLGGKSETL